MLAHPYLNLFEKKTEGENGYTPLGKHDRGIKPMQIYGMAALKWEFLYLEFFVVLRKYYRMTENKCCT